MKALSLLAFAASSACVEVVSLTQPRADATVERDATSVCSQPEQDQLLVTLHIDDAARCIGARPRVRACRVVVSIPVGESAASWCTATLGRVAVEGEPSSCSIRAAPSYERSGALAAGDHGMYFDSSGCVAITDEPGGWRAGLSGRLECLTFNEVTTGAACDLRPLGASCRVGATTTCLFVDAGAGCGSSSTTLARAISHECATGVCLAQGDGGAVSGACSCRCALASDVDAGRSPLCACPSGFECVAALEHPSTPEDLRGRYCVRTR